MVGTGIRTSSGRWRGLIALVAGFVKGAVGFAMPMIMISGLGSFLPAASWRWRR